MFEWANTHTQLVASVSINLMRLASVAHNGSQTGTVTSQVGHVAKMQLHQQITDTFVFALRTLADVHVDSSDTLHIACLFR